MPRPLLLLSLLARLQGSARPGTKLEAGTGLPEFEFQDLDGRPFRRADLGGRAVILKFGTTW